MNKEQFLKYRAFFTIEKTIFDYFSQKMQNKKHRFYTKITLPPMYKHLLNPTNKEGDLYRDSFNYPDEVWFKQKEISAEIRMRFIENIKLQNQIMDIIKKRVIEYNYWCGIIKVKTGMWKTHIVMDIIEYLQVPTLILVSNKKLMSEMIEKISTMSNISPEQYWDWKKNIGKITVMTKSSYLIVDKELMEDFGCVLVDELQTWFSPKFRDKFNTDFNHKDIFFYWLSATPSTNDLNQKDLEKYYGKSIEISNDYDFIPEFTFFNYYSSSSYEFEHYAELKQCLIDDEERFKQQYKYIDLNTSDKCSLILCDRLEEIENWYEEFKTYDDFVIIKITWSTQVEDDNKQLKDALKQDKPIIIIGSIQKAATGFDYPIIDTVFIFSSIKFENTVIQSVGRALRKAPWKTWAKVYLWNDLPILNKQRLQKATAIKKEYGIGNIKTIDIGKVRKEKSTLALTF